MRLRRMTVTIIATVMMDATTTRMITATRTAPTIATIVMGTGIEGCTRPAASGFATAPKLDAKTRGEASPSIPTHGAALTMPTTATTAALVTDTNTASTTPKHTVKATKAPIADTEDMEMDITGKLG